MGPILLSGPADFRLSSFLVESNIQAYGVREQWQESTRSSL